MIQRCRIGRNNGNDLVIKDRAAEEFHAVISMDEDTNVFIQDLNSRYGTLVNGERISQKQLFPGDEVQIGFARINWESYTNPLPDLTEVEVRPSLSVPVKRPVISGIESLPQPSEERISTRFTGEAAPTLAKEMIETNMLVERLEKDMRHQEAQDVQNQTTSSPTLEAEVKPLQQLEEKPSLPEEKQLPVQEEKQSEPIEQPKLAALPQEETTANASSKAEKKEETNSEMKEANKPEITANAPARSKKMSEQTLILLVIALTLGLVLAGWLIGTLL
jgi:pSer/pThr/pTyr-binding forkhead associated (FHA) protein